MKKSLKRVLCGILVTVMSLCTVATFDFDVTAAESTEAEVAAEYFDDGVAAEVEDNPVAQEIPEQIVTEPVESVPATEPSTAPVTTPAPTTIPTTKPTTAPAPTVGKVKNITKTSFETDKITLKWDKVSGATGYVIYYCNYDKTTKFTKLAEIKSNSCTISKLAHTTQYHFKIAAYIEKNGKKYEGTASLKRTATQPANIAKITLQSSSSSIKFSWTRNTKATGYKIYRSCAKTGGKYVLYKTIKNNSTTTLTDTNVEKSKSYYYIVKSYRNCVNGSTYHSANKIIRATSGLGTIDFTMTSQLNRVSFSWTKNKYAHGYDIYYSTSKNGTYKKLATTKNDYYNTGKLPTGKTYYFRIRAYRTVGTKKYKVVGTYTTKSKKVSNLAYKQNVGNTYIEISIKQQHMWFYVDGKLYCQTDVVTGNNDGYHNTTKGTFKIFQRCSPATLVGAGYVSHVDYWLGFTSSGIGIHDASWRTSSEYGGSTYKGNGSHGCVNTPYSAVKKIYQKAKIGTYVVVY